MRITKVSMINPVGIMDIHTRVHGNVVCSCQDLYLALDQSVIHINEPTTLILIHNCHRKINA